MDYRHGDVATAAAADNNTGRAKSICDDNFKDHTMIWSESELIKNKVKIT